MALLLGIVGANAQGTIKVGVILPYSGQFADTATQLDGGIKLYMKQHGDTVAGKKIEMIRKDSGGVAPDVAKRLAQELVVRDNVDILAGFVLSPNTLAAADVSAQAKKFMVVMNAGASLIMTKSPYVTRVSITLPQVAEAFGPGRPRAASRRSTTMVSDFAPGHDAEAGIPSRVQGSRRRNRRCGAVSRGQSGFLGLHPACQGFRARKRSSCSCPPARSRPPSGRR